MSNQERAAQVLLKHWSVAQETGQDDECDCCAQALADAGLLISEPTNHEIQMLRAKCRELEAENKAQAEKIKRLQAALREVDKDSFWASSDRYVGIKPLTYEEPDWEDYNLLPGDMEATDE